MKIYYYLRSTVKRERFFVFVSCSFFKRDSFSRYCDDWANEIVLFGARNYECLFHNCFDFCYSPLKIVKIENIT